MKDLRSPLAKARDKWLETKRDDIDAWALESSVDPKYILARLELAFLDGANAQKAIDDQAEALSDIAETDAQLL